MCVCEECVSRGGLPHFSHFVLMTILVQGYINILPLPVFQESEQARTDYVIRALTVEYENVSSL